VRKTFVLHGNSLEDERLGRLADLRDLDLELPLQCLHFAGSKAVAKSRVVVAQPALIARPALIPGPAQPGVELVLHGALDDQPRPEPRQLRQRLARVLADPHGKQPVDLFFNHRRRRYVRYVSRRRPPSIVLSGLEGTYAVALTAPGLFTALLRVRPALEVLIE
jgi:hypothetical protein